MLSKLLMVLILALMAIQDSLAADVSLTSQTVVGNILH